MEAVWETADNLFLPSPRRPAEPPKRPWLFSPHPNKKSGTASWEPKERVSLAKKPTEKDESPYWMPYTQVDAEHPGSVLVAVLTSEHNGELHVTFEYVDDSDGSNTGSFCL